MAAIVMLALVALISIFLYIANRLTKLRAFRIDGDVFRAKKALQGLPSPKYGIMGIVPHIQSRNIHRYLTAWADQLGPIFKIRVAAVYGVVITDPVLARSVLRSKHLDKFRFMYAFTDPFLAGLNMLTGHTDAYWHAVRKGVAPAFSVANMRANAPYITKCAYRLVRVLGAEGASKPVNIDDLLLRHFMDIIGHVGFQKEIGSLEGFERGSTEDPSSYAKLMLHCCEEVTRRVETPLSHLTGALGPNWRKGNVLFKKWQDLVRTGLLKHIKAIDTVPGSFGDLLLKVRDPNTGQPLTDQQMLAEISGLFFAGIDTSGHTGTWALFYISQNPKVEAKIMAELDAAELLVTPARQQPRQIGYDDIGRLPYLRCVIKETLRMFPTLSVGQVRISEKHDIELCGGKLVVPRNTLIWVPHHAMQNTIHNWDRPQEFLPERWEDPTAEYAKASLLPADWHARVSTTNGVSRGIAEVSFSDEAERAKRYFPFAEGPRNCVGQSLAQTTLPITLAALLSHFTFRLAEQMGGPEGVREREEYTLVTTVRGGMFMHAIPRHIA